VLARHGWRYLSTLTNGVEVWENPSVALPQDDPPASVFNPLASISWGTLPLTALIVTGTLAWLKRRRRND
jgi:hypothetical protein